MVLRIGWLLALWALAEVAMATKLKDNLKYFETLHKSDLSHNVVKRGADPSR